MAVPYSFAGQATTINATPIAYGPDIGALYVRRINLRNRTGSAVGFILRRIILDHSNQEIRVEEFDDSIPANDRWSWGEFNAVMILMPGCRIELLLDSAPTIPVDWVVDGLVQ